MQQDRGEKRNYDKADMPQNVNELVLHYLYKLKGFKFLLFLDSGGQNMLFLAMDYHYV